MALADHTPRAGRSMAVVVLALAIALGLAGVARAQGLAPGDGPVREVALSRADFSLTGQVTATFTGPGFEGTTVLRPFSVGELRAAELATRGGRRFDLSLFGAIASPGATAVTRVVRTAPDGRRSVCTDARSQSFSSADAYSEEPVIALVGSRTALPRCPGPIAADLAAAIPTLRLAPASLAAGPRRFDLRGERPLRAGALTGTVRSSLVLRLDDVSTRRRTRVREVFPGGTRSTGFRVESVRGAIGVDFEVPGDAPECAELDNCGLTGSLAFSPAAIGPDRGLGGFTLSRGRLFGFIALTDGAVSARLRRPDGSTCEDDLAPAPPAFLELAGGRDGRVTIALRGPLGRSRCGEPDLRDFAERPLLARGTTTRAALARRRTTLRLTRGGFDVQGPAGRARLRSDLSVTISRVGRD